MHICYIFILHYSSSTIGEDNNINQKKKAKEFNCSLCISSFSRWNNLSKYMRNKYGKIENINMGKLKASTKNERTLETIL